MTLPMKWFLISALALTAACGSIATAAKPKHAGAGLDLRTPLALQTRTSYADRFGSMGQFSRHSPQERPNIEAYLKPERAPKALPAAVAHRPAPVRVARLTAAPPVAVAAPVSAAPDTRLAVSAAPSVTADAQRYAVRESTAKKQQDFRGGSVVVISAGAILVGLLVVVVILLILR